MNCVNTPLSLRVGSPGFQGTGLRATSLPPGSAGKTAAHKTHTHTKANWLLIFTAFAFTFSGWASTPNSSARKNSTKANITPSRVLSSEQRAVFQNAKVAQLAIRLPTGRIPVGESPFEAELHNVLEGLGVRVISRAVTEPHDVLYRVELPERVLTNTGHLTVFDTRASVPPYTVEFQYHVTSESTDQPPAPLEKRISTAVDMDPFRTALLAMIDDIYGAGAGARASAKSLEQALRSGQERAKQNDKMLETVRQYKVGVTSEEEFLRPGWLDWEDGQICIIEMNVSDPAGGSAHIYALGHYALGSGGAYGHLGATPGSGLSKAIADLNKRQKQSLEFSIKSGSGFKRSIQGAPATVTCRLKFAKGVLTSVEWVEK